MAGPDRLVRLGIDTRRDSDERATNARRGSALGLVGRVQHDEGAELGCEPKLLVRLVVAVDDEPVACQSRGPCECELTERRDVRAEPFLGEEPQQGDVGERLRAVDDRASPTTRRKSRARSRRVRSQ